MRMRRLVVLWFGEDLKCGLLSVGSLVMLHAVQNVTTIDKVVGVV